MMNKSTSIDVFSTINPKYHHIFEIIDEKAIVKDARTLEALEKGVPAFIRLQPVYAEGLELLKRHIKDVDMMIWLTRHVKASDLGADNSFEDNVAASDVFIPELDNYSHQTLDWLNQASAGSIKVEDNWSERRKNAAWSSNADKESYMRRQADAICNSGTIVHAIDLHKDDIKLLPKLGAVQSIIHSKEIKKSAADVVLLSGYYIYHREWIWLARLGYVLEKAKQQNSYPKVFMQMGLFHAGFVVKLAQFKSDVRYELVFPNGSYNQDNVIQMSALYNQTAKSRQELSATITCARSFHAVA